jgi:hypothetical protein
MKVKNSSSGITSVLMTFIINRALHWSVGNNIFHCTPFSRAHKGYWCGGCLSLIDEEFSSSSTDEQRLGAMAYPVISNWMQIHITQLSNQSEYGSTDMMDHADVLVSLLKKFGSQMTRNADMASVHVYYRPLAHDSVIQALDQLMDDRISILLDPLYHFSWHMPVFNWAEHKVHGLPFLVTSVLGLV